MDSHDVSEVLAVDVSAGKKGIPDSSEDPETRQGHSGLAISLSADTLGFTQISCS